MINFFRELKNCSRQVNFVLDKFITSSFSYQNSTLIQAMRYAVILSGKRLRPFLVYQTGRLFGLTPRDLDASAAAIECIHAYSLIHDDLPSMDNDHLRRGKPSCHIQFGENNAILAGDALQTLAFTILSEAPMPAISIENRIKMIAILANASGAEGMCFGQSLDIESKNKKVSLSTLKTIHKYKTGALIRASVHMGSIIAGKKYNSVLILLDRYADIIGLAFQIKDDILDITCHNKTIDKSPKSNKKLKKNTYSNLIGLKKLYIEVYKLYNESLLLLKRIAKLGYDVDILFAFSRYIIKRNK